MGGKGLPLVHVDKKMTIIVPVDEEDGCEGFLREAKMGPWPCRQFGRRILVILHVCQTRQQLHNFEEILLRNKRSTRTVTYEEELTQNPA